MVTLGAVLIQARGEKYSLLHQAGSMKTLSMTSRRFCGVRMFRFFSKSNQSVTEYVAALDLELPDDLAALNPGLDAPHPPIPALEVHEKNDDAIWELWQDSVAFQDSQFADGLGGDQPLKNTPAATEDTSPFIDVFASVHKKSR